MNHFKSGMIPVLAIGGILCGASAATPLSTGLRWDFTTTWMNPDAEPVPLAGKSGTAHRVDVVYPYEAVLLEATPLQRFRGSSIGRLLAVSGDGMVHGVHLSEPAGPLSRRSMAWCVAPDTSLIGPEPMLELRTGFPTVACTGQEPVNGLPPHSGVAGLGSDNGWFGTDFLGCTLAFQLGGSLEELLGNPYVAVDARDQIHGIGRTGFQDSLWYDLSVDGASSPGASLVSGGGNVLAGALTAARHAPAAALLFLRQAPCAPDIVVQDAPQWGMDLYLAEARDEFANLRAVVEEGDTLNLTRTHCPDRRGPLACGAFAYRDADALYDEADVPGLHLALTTPRLMPDTIRFQDLLTGETTATPIVDASMHSTLWHLDPATGTWSRIAGWMTGVDEEDEVPWPEIWRVRRDRVQLAHDPQTGFLYALWNEFNRHDLCDTGLPNAELFMACSADGGASWGEAVNVTQTATPGCAMGECESEVSASLAERGDGGFLHLSFLLDTYPDDETLTENAVYYMRVPVAEVPPPDGAGWDAAGHVGLDHHLRPWWFTEGHPDSLRVWDSVGLWNEGDAPRRLVALEVLHHPLDEPGGPDSALSWTWELLRGDPVEPQGWQEAPATEADWDGQLPARSLVQTRVSVTHRGLPLAEQVFRFTFDDGTVRRHRFAYEGPNGQGSLVLPLDLDDPDGIVADTLYRNLELAVAAPRPAAFALRAAPNPFNPSTWLEFTLEQAGPVRLELWNLAGQRVETLLDGEQAAGLHTLRVDGSALATGVYLARLEAGARREAVKLLLVK